MTSCSKCPYAFDGQVFCMACATGYALRTAADADGWAIGLPLQLVQVFRMETQQLKGKVRYKMLTHQHPTGTFLTIVGNGEFVTIGGEAREGLCVPTEGVPCPFCAETQLVCGFDAPGRCPHCGALSLSRSVKF